MEKNLSSDLKLQYLQKQYNIPQQNKPHGTDTGCSWIYLDVSHNSLLHVEKYKRAGSALQTCLKGFLGL